jgi:PAS domain S-box-containing protein
MLKAATARHAENFSAALPLPMLKVATVRHAEHRSAALPILELLPFLEEKGRLGIWSWDLKTQSMEWSEGFFRLLGLEPGSVEPSYTLLQSASTPNNIVILPADGIESLVAEGGQFEREFRTISSDGRVRWILSRGEFFVGENGKATKAAGIITDTTRLHAALSRAEAIQDRLSFLIEATSATLWTMGENDLPGDRHAWCRLTGQTLAELANSGWLNAVHPDDREAARDAWNSALAGSTPYNFEYRLRRADGEYRWVRSRAVPTQNRDRLAGEWVCVTLDIHAEKIWSRSHQSIILTAEQIRAARGILNWSVRDLAEASKTSASSIRRIEEFGVKESDVILLPLRMALEAAGIEFIFPFSGKPGVRPR